VATSVIPGKFAPPASGPASERSKTFARSTMVTSGHGTGELMQSCVKVAHRARREQARNMMQEMVKILGKSGAVVSASVLDDDRDHLATARASTLFYEPSGSR